MYWRSVAKKDGMHIPARAQQMQETMVSTVKPATKAEAQRAKDLFNQGLSKIDIAKAISK